MKLYDYWIDAYGNSHAISDMNTQYISHCLNQLRKWLDAWHGIIPEMLTAEEMKQRDEVGMKAWFTFNGIPYIEAFCAELKKRGIDE